MIRVILSTVILTAMIEAGGCWKINDMDLRKYCESIVEGKKSCWMIKDMDSRHYCEAIAYNKKTCWRIKDNDKKELCRAITGQ